MSKVMDEMINECILADRYELAKALWDEGIHDIEKISRLTELTMEQVKEAISIQST